MAYEKYAVLHAFTAASSPLFPFKTNLFDL